MRISRYYTKPSKNKIMGGPNYNKALSKVLAQDCPILWPPINQASIKGTASDAADFPVCTATLDEKEFRLT